MKNYDSFRSENPSIYNWNKVGKYKKYDACNVKRLKIKTFNTINTNLNLLIYFILNHFFN